MRDSFHDFLFSKGVFVGVPASEHAPEVLLALAHLFNIRIVSNPGMASLDMVQIASRNLGEDVPAPFYRGFPKSVLELDLNHIVADRLVHYINTYGLGDFSRAGHSVFEREVVRECLDEDIPVRDFSIVSEDDALALLEDTVRSLLTSTRPLNNVRYDLVLALMEDYGFEVSTCASKDTACRLLLDTRDVSLARLLKLSDVIRLVEWLQLKDYDGESIKRLNLRNRDRKFLTAVLDRIFEEGDVDLRACLEKRKLWKGLLCHLHYKPKDDSSGPHVVRAFWDERARSVYSSFEREMRAGRIQRAVDVLRDGKGAGAVLRNLDYLLSRCTTDEEVDYVLDAIDTNNKILLVQLLMHYGKECHNRRVFRFQKFGKLCVHHETDREAARRRSNVDEDVAMRASLRVLSALEDACKGTLGKVYVDEGMRRIGLPVQEGTSMGGVGTLSRGSRLPIPEGKKIRAFTYWKRVDDIDLSAFAFADDGTRIEFSWRTTLVSDEGLNDVDIAYSGDQTSGYFGGSEFFDVDLDQFAENYAGFRYLVFCDNVYTGLPFTACVCRAGYMMRDVEDSGEVFEPATVASSFPITCASTFAFLFAIDLETREIVWLNIARDSGERVAGLSYMDYIREYLDVTDVINLYDFAQMLATEVVDDPAQADVVFSDRDEQLKEGAERIRSIDVERVMRLLR